MIDDVYQQALAALQHHLDEARADYSLDEGELVLNGHRLGLSIAFDGLVQQGAHTLAPLDIQLHLDGDSGDRFRVGTLGVGKDASAAVHDAIFEWHLLAAAPLLAALGAPVENRRSKTPPMKLAGWNLFAGRVGIRGNMPPELRAGGPFYRVLLESLRSTVGGWQRPDRFELRSLYLMAAREPQKVDIQAAVDGIVNPELVQSLSELNWPASNDAYLYKQLFVLSSQEKA